MAAHPSSPGPRACPRCGHAILWLDGEPSPELVYVAVGAGAGKDVIGCASCSVVNDLRKRVKSPARIATEEVIATTIEEVSNGVDLLKEGLDVYDKVRGFLGKFRKTPTKPPDAP